MAIDQAWLRQQFPDISISRPLDAGGQKSVFAGTHVRDGEVVLKIFHPGSDVERALREVQAVSQINSPRVPRILEVGTKSSPMGDVIWFREEFVAGESLRHVLGKTRLSDHDILRLGLHILEALASAEQARIVHRDVKPENIIVSPNNSSFWLLDFGIARHLDQTSLTATSLAYGLGTAGYAPPEQFRNLKPDIDARSDLFALGVTLYEAAEGVNPFHYQARDVGEILRRTETIPLPRISRQIDSRNELSQLIMAITRIQPNHRLDNAAEALTWMQEICAIENVS
jgi:eukaryotic-like serine/threonine-protein kinase